MDQFLTLQQKKNIYIYIYASGLIRGPENANFMS